MPTSIAGPATKRNKTYSSLGILCDRMDGSVHTGKGTSTDSYNVGIPPRNELLNVRRGYVLVRIWRGDIV
jgi:hypothetical protein